MSLTITISGVYLDPEAQPLPGVTLIFETVYNSSQTQLQTTVKTVTDDSAAYKISLVPDVYTVSEINSGRKKWLGNIQIFADSVPGTLNEYLTSFQPDQYRPGILSEMEEILEETKTVAANAGVVPCGAYAADTQYVANDLVEFDGSEYRATADTMGVAPPAAPWELFVSAGAQGEQGEKGEKGDKGDTGEQGEQGIQGEKGETGATGPVNTLSVGTVTTLDAGEDAAAEITGAAPDQTLNLSIPQGEQGLQGEQGIQGEKGETGEQGETGATGPANTLTIGTVTTLAPGEQATAEIAGDAPDQVLNLGIPQGETGSSAITVPEEWDSPGAYVFAYYPVGNDETYHMPGEEFAASTLYVGEILFSDADGVKTSDASWATHPRGGTWRLQGNTATGVPGTNIKSCLIFLRIDGVTSSLHPEVMMLRSTESERVKNCRYSSPDNSTIDCEVEANGKWHPFTAALTDVTEWGRDIYAAAAAGELGDVAPYQG